MPVKPDDLGYTSGTSVFSFREIGSIKIPKSVRERAFQLEVSVEIVGVANDGYQNFKSYPSHGFFGYAVLVFYNYMTALIPLQFGRNTLYFERHEAAYSSWETFKRYHSTRYDFWELTDVVGQLASYLGATVTPAPYDPPIWKGFEELPLREVYVKCPFGTTFRIEATHKRANLFFDMDGNEIKPESKRVDDPSKDGGLPSVGVLPNTAPNSDAPYDGFDPPSTPLELGDWSNNDKLPSSSTSGLGLDRPNSANSPTTEGTGSLRWMRVIARVKRAEFAGGCGVTRVEDYCYEVLSDTQVISLTPPLSQLPNGCGQMVPAGAWIIQLTGGNPFPIGSADSPPTISFERGETVPAGRTYFE
jgi:hypothetical protein